MAAGQALPDHITLYVIRHGETDWNAERRYQGQADIPLNDKGHVQAQRNGAALAGLGIDFSAVDFVASPLIRARETMVHVRAALDLPADEFRLDPLLKELSYGHWQGQLQSELPELDPAGIVDRAKDPYRWRPNDGESYADLVARTRSWLQSVGQDSVVVAHGGTLRCLHTLLLGAPETDVPTLKTPQDKVCIIKAGACRWI